MNNIEFPGRGEVLPPHQVLQELSAHAQLLASHAPVVPFDHGMPYTIQQSSIQTASNGDHYRSQIVRNQDGTTDYIQISAWRRSGSNAPRTSVDLSIYPDGEFDCVINTKSSIVRARRFKARLKLYLSSQN
jgi:hypothetical protein